MERIEVTQDTIRRILGTLGRIERPAQVVHWEDAFNLAVGVGELLVPGFVIDDSNRFAYEQVCKWVVGDTTMLCSKPDGEGTSPGDITKGLYIQGPTGTGKSILINICRRLCRGFKTPYSDGTSTNALTWSSYSADYICSEYERTGSLTLFRDEPIICIQDLGTEPGEALYMGTRRNCLRSILEYRGDRGDKMTHITSNIPLGKAGEYYGERVQSRLYQMCNPITMRGTDRRIK